jgi:hypothetical protein
MLNDWKKTRIQTFILISIAAGTFTLSGNTVNGQTPAAVLSHNVVDNNAAYDIIFRTASAGAIKTVEMTFPEGTNIENATLLEVNGIGQGESSATGQTWIYAISNPVNIPSDTSLRFEIWNIINPRVPGNYTVEVTTKDSGGGTIDSARSTPYQIKQIRGAQIMDNDITALDLMNAAVNTYKIGDGQVKTGNIANKGVTTDKIAPDAVTGTEISGVRKLIFSSCTVDPTIPSTGNQHIIEFNCDVPGASTDDNVLITSGYNNPCVDIRYAYVAQVNLVHMWAWNVCYTS